MMPLPENVNWQVVIINLFAAIPGIILAVATLIRVIRTGKVLEETNLKTDKIKQEADEVKHMVENVERIANGNKVIRAPRRATDPPGSDMRKNGTKTGS